MIVVLKISTFDLDNLKEILLQVKLNNLAKKIHLADITVYPIKNIKQTILRAPNGDKKTGQDSLQCLTYTAVVQIYVFKLKTFINISRLILKNCNKIEIKLLKT